MAKAPFVIHGLDRFENDLSAALQVGHSSVDFLGLDDDEAVDKVRVNCPVGETPATDPDAFEDAVASKLVHHQGGVQQQGGLVVVWHDASDEVGIGLIERGQKLVKLRPERGGDRFEDLGTGVLSLLLLLLNLLGLAGMISEEINNQHVLALLHLVHNLVEDIIKKVTLIKRCSFQES